MKAHFYFLALLLFCSVSMGGSKSFGVVRCTGKLKGLYSVDYLKLLKAGKISEELRTEYFMEEAFALQYFGLYGYSHSALNFRGAITNPQPTDYSNFIVSKPTYFGFKPEDLGENTKLISPDCVPAMNQLLIVFRLENNPNNLIVQYDANLQAELKQTSELQLNFLISRMWLSDLTDDDELILQINEKWHRKDLYKDLTVLDSMAPLFERVYWSAKSLPSNCDRTQFINESLKRQFLKNCDQVTKDDLLKVKNLEILDTDRQFIAFSDFSVRKYDLDGLTNLKSFKAINIPWFGIALFEGFFNYIPNLEELDLSGTRVMRITAKNLPKSNSLRSLNLSRIQGGGISPGTFKNVFSKDPNVKTFLDLSGAQIYETSKDVLQGLETLKAIDLSSLGLEELDVSFLRGIEDIKIDDVVMNLQLNSANHPNLKKLIVSRGYTDKHVRMTGSWPQLEYLELSYQGISGLPNTISFFDFPNLKFIDLSAQGITQFITPEGVPSGFAELTKLEHIHFFDPGFMDRDFLFNILTKELPPNVKLIEVCSQYWSDNPLYARIIKKHIAKTHPGIKIRTKLKCSRAEGWIDVEI